eukprot:scaffold215086_cov25-Prasinocladus_malaysianus.AAC.4
MRGRWSRGVEGRCCVGCVDGRGDWGELSGVVVGEEWLWGVGAGGTPPIGIWEVVVLEGSTRASRNWYVAGISWVVTAWIASVKADTQGCHRL